MYLNFDVTQVPGGYIVQTRMWDEESEEDYHETTVFTSLDGVRGWLEEYFTTNLATHGGIDDGGEEAEAASPVPPLLPGSEEKDV